MYHALLFFHVLSAFLLFAAVVIFSAFVLGAAPADRRWRIVTEILWGVGGLGTLALGIWLALYVDAYRISDGWIVAAIVLWFLATGTGAQTSRALRPMVEDGVVAIGSRAATMHWLRTLLVVVLLADMIFKPGA